MKTCVASILLMLYLKALLLVAGLSAAAVADDGMDAIRLPRDGTGLADLLTATTSSTEGEKKRPWRCCDLALCTRSSPPICRCLDKVDRCSGSCKECKETEDSRHTCADWYHGFPGPRCKEDDGGLADQSVSTTVRAAAAGKKDDTTRPWKCCDLQVCTRSQPPICHCWDEVKRCAKACKRCEEVEGSDPSRYRCLDVHRGDPGPRCSRRGGRMMHRTVDAVLRGYSYLQPQ